MATVDPIQEDFLGQVLKALQQRSNFGKDITDEIGRTEAQLDTPNPFSQVFDLDERRALQQGEQRRTQGVLNNLQDQLSQRNQAIGNVAESVNRGFEAARGQSNIERQFGLDEQRIAIEQQRANQAGAGGAGGGLTANQAIDNQRADLELALQLEKFNVGREDVAFERGEAKKTRRSNAITDAQNARLEGVPERQIAQTLNAQGVTQGSFKSGVTLVGEEAKRRERIGQSLEEIQTYIIDQGYSPSRFGLPNPKAQQGTLEQLLGAIGLNR